MNLDIKASARTATAIALAGAVFAGCSMLTVPQAQAATLGTPAVHSWKKTDDSSWPSSPYYHKATGVTWTITWDAVSGAKGYQVRLGEQSGSPHWYNWKQTTKKRLASVSFSFCSKIRAKVRAYKRVNGKKVYGKWSRVVTKKIPY